MIKKIKNYSIIAALITLILLAYFIITKTNNIVPTKNTSISNNIVPTKNTSISNTTSITNIPYVINKAGHYTLTKNLKSNKKNFNAITIKASNVTLDLNNYTLSNDDAGTNTQSVGIYVENGYNNIEIKRGTIKKFMYGIQVRDISKTYVNTNVISIHNMILHQNTFRGIRADGTAISIYNNSIIDTGPTTFYKDAFVFGIEFYGRGAKIEHNHVFNTQTTGKGELVGISASGTTEGSFIMNNTISNVAIAKNSYGIWVGGRIPIPNNISISNNYISNFDKCFFTNKFSIIHYSNNEPFNCNTKYDIYNAIPRQ